MRTNDAMALPDLQIKRLDQRSWQVTAVSQRAHLWFSQQAVGGAHMNPSKVETNLPEINRLAVLARSNGLVIELHGPNGVIHL